METQISAQSNKQTPQKPKNGTEEKMRNCFAVVISFLTYFAALLLFIYEIVILSHDIWLKRLEGISPERIFYALILSTTVAAFVGMHFVVNTLVLSKMGLSGKDIKTIFTLMASALLLAGLIILHNIFFN